MSNYVTEEEATTYIMANKLIRIAWDNSTVEEHNVALTMATRAIDRLAYKGSKSVATQEHEFPRGAQTEVPESIKEACAELAYSFLDGREAEFEFENLVVLNKQFGSVSTTSKANFDHGYKAAGIVSLEAWKLLRPWLREHATFKLVKV